MTSHTIDLGMVGRTLEALLQRGDRHVAMRDPVDGRARIVDAGLASAPDGLLPVFLVAADAVWRDATDRSFGVALRREPATLLGFRAEAVAGGPFSAVMLSMMEAIEQVARPGVILINDFDGLWRDIGRDLRPGDDPRGRPDAAPARS